MYTIHTNKWPTLDLRTYDVLSFVGDVVTNGYNVTSSGAFSAICHASFSALTDACNYADNLAQYNSTQGMHYAVVSRLDNDVVYVY